MDRQFRYTGSSSCLHMKGNTAMLELKNLSFTADSDGSNAEIIRGLNLTVEDNKFVVITGPNGGGKSTLAKLIAGIVKNTESAQSSVSEGKPMKIVVINSSPHSEEQSTSRYLAQKFIGDYHQGRNGQTV